MWECNICEARKIFLISSVKSNCSIFKFEKINKTTIFCFYIPWRWWWRRCQTRWLCSRNTFLKIEYFFQTLKKYIKQAEWSHMHDSEMSWENCFHFLLYLWRVQKIRLLWWGYMVAKKYYGILSCFLRKIMIKFLYKLYFFLFLFRVRTISLQITVRRWMRTTTELFPFESVIFLTARGWIGNDHGKGIQWKRFLELGTTTIITKAGLKT